MTLHDLISGFDRIEYLEFCAFTDICGEDGQAMSELVGRNKDDYEWIIEWVEAFRKGEEGYKKFFEEMNVIPEAVAKSILKQLLKDGNYDGMKQLLNNRVIV
jgi:hypothetical protein